MKKLLLAFSLLTGGVLAMFVYERMFVDRTIGPVAMAAIAVLAAVVAVLVTMYRLYDTRHREVVVSVCLAVGSTVVSYLVIDLITGFFLIRPLSPPLVPDQYRHHKMVANSYSSFEQRDFHYVQRVNNFGMRGQDIAAGKSANSYRILMLGDSFTMGKGVEDNQTFSVLLQKSLRQRVAACGGTRSIEVLNGGSDSYAPILSYIQLKRDLAPLKPDMVVLNLDASDLVQETAYRQLAVFDKDGDIVGVPQGEQETSFTARVRTWTERHMFLTRVLVYYLLERADYQEFNVRSVVEQANVEITAHTLESDTEPRDKQWHDIFDSLSRIKAFADSRGMTFLLSVYPWGHQVSASEWVPGRYTYMAKDAVPSDKSRHTVRDLSRSNGIGFIDLFPAFRAYTGDRKLYFQYDMHWTSTGQEVAAKGLEEYLFKEYSQALCR